jgi:hypothetical protein
LARTANNLETLPIIIASRIGSGLRAGAAQLAHNRPELDVVELRTTRGMPPKPSKDQNKMHKQSKLKNSKNSAKIQ